MAPGHEDILQTTVRLIDPIFGAVQEKQCWLLMESLKSNSSLSKVIVSNGRALYCRPLNITPLFRKMKELLRCTDCLKQTTNIICLIFPHCKLPSQVLMTN